MFGVQTMTKSFHDPAFSPYMITAAVTVGCPKCRKQMNIGSIANKGTVTLDCPSCRHHDELAINYDDFTKEVFEHLSPDYAEKSLG